MKILGSDYDGTLNAGGIGEAKISAIQKWRKKGNKFGIITGRNGTFRDTLLEKYPQLECDFFATCNGGYIMDGEGNIIYEARCNSVSLSSLVKDLFDWGVKYVCIIVGKKLMWVISTTEDKPQYAPKQDSFLLVDIPDVEYFNQISLSVSDSYEASLLTEKIKKYYGQWLNPLQNGKSIDVVSVGVNKAQGIYRVMELFNGDYNDVIVVGDNINDTDMLREFYSYAMENSIEQVRNCADRVVRDVTELLEKELADKS